LKPLLENNGSSSQLTKQLNNDGESMKRKSALGAKNPTYYQVGAAGLLTAIPNPDNPIQALAHLASIPPPRGAPQNMLKIKKSSTRFLSQHSTPMDKYTTGAPAKREQQQHADVRIRESKNTQMLEKFMQRNTTRMTVNSQPSYQQEVASPEGPTGGGGGKFGLPSLASVGNSATAGRKLPPA